MNTNSDSDFKCNFCKNPQTIMYEGWFYTDQKNNPFAKGTASASLMQLHTVCKKCLIKAINNKMTKATLDDVGI